MLEEQFSDEVSEEIIEELASELSGEAYEWSGKEHHFDHVDIVEPNPGYFDDFQKEVGQIEEMIDAVMDEKIKSQLLKLLFVNLITLLETFLSEAFTTSVFSNPKFTRSFVEKNKDFKKRKITLSNIFNEHGHIDLTIKKYLSDLIWHRLDKVELLFKYTFNINFSPYSTLYEAVKIRHFLVHKNGKNDKGKIMEITKAEFESTKDKICSFVLDLNKKLDKIN